MTQSPSQRTPFQPLDPIPNDTIPQDSLSPSVSSLLTAVLLHIISPSRLALATI